MLSSEEVEEAEEGDLKGAGGDEKRLEVDGTIFGVYLERGRRSN